ncbi:MAG TPA: PIN domain-containing protein [Candidatus Dormibacteraeota bacterium]
MNGATYDTGALLAAEAGDARMWAKHRRLLEQRARPVVPAVVLAQAWRGGPQHRLSRLLASCRIEDFGNRPARDTGSALAASGTRDIVDAAVVVSALMRGDEVITSDADDLLHIAGALGRRIDVRPPP